MEDHHREDLFKHEYDDQVETDCGIIRIESRYFWMGQVFVRPRSSVIRPGKERVVIHLEAGISQGYLIRLHQEIVCKIKEVGGTAFFSHVVKLPWRQRKLRFNHLVKEHLAGFFSFDVIMSLDRIEPKHE